MLAHLLVTGAVEAATVPNGFRDLTVVNGLRAPTAMTIAPDGRLLVCEQAGTLRVVRNGVLLTNPFVTLDVDARGERGLIGVALDPDFGINGYLYLHYTSPTCVSSSGPCNRVSRFTANGDVAVPGSERVLIEMDPLTNATNHNGGALHFDDRGALLIGAGENATRSNAQTLSNLLGKVLRINSNGTIPTDNPFYGSTTGRNRAIWALGLRNPFTFAVQPGTGRVFINDVGQSTYEEINDGIAGANYGWPDSEGPTTNPAHTAPLYYYGHGSGWFLGCAIAGGTFYSPSTTRFPPDYRGDYFFADLCAGWINRRDSATGAVSTFASGITLPVDLDVAADGSLYYLARGPVSGVVGRVEYVVPRLEALAAVPEPPFRTGVPITWTVTPGPGSAIVEYQFWLYTAATNTWTASPYSSSTSFSFTPSRSGPYAVQVWARNVGSTAMWESYLGSVPFTVFEHPIQVTALTPNQQLPLAAGMPATWSVNATGGDAPLEYAFWVYTTATRSWKLDREYSSSSTWTWTPSQPGTYVIQAWVRQTGSQTSYDAWRGTGFIGVESPLPTTPTLAVVPSLPAPAGTQFTWTATSTGGKRPTQYRFWLYDGTTRQWQLGQDWSARSTWTWQAVREGTYAVQVWVRSAGSQASFEAWAGSGPFSITPAPLKVHSLTSDPELPTGGGPITWTVTATGGDAPLEYRFWGQTNGVWAMLRDYAQGNSVTWNLARGTYRLQAWVRNAGSASSYDAWFGSGQFSTTPTPVTIQFLDVTQTFPLPAATLVTWTVSATGGSAALEYQFWRYSGGSWKVVQAWSPSRTWTWTPAAGDVGEHLLQVWVRSVGAGVSFEAWTASGVFQISP